MSASIHKYKNLPFYALILTTMGISGFEKLVESGVPDWFISQFSDSPIDLFPGILTITWFLILILQILAFVLVLVAIIRGEHIEEAPKKWSFPAFLVTETVFVILGFGQRIIQNYDIAFWLFAYAVLTFLGARAVLKEKR